MRLSAPVVALAATAAVGLTVVAGPLPATGAPAGPTASAAAARAGSTTVDDRQLVDSKGWKKIKDKKAYKKTLSRSTKKKATLTTKAAAGAGGSVTFEVGPKRGRVQITVGSTKVKKVSTAAKKASFKSVSFAGAGKVKVTVLKPGKKGVYVDKVVLQAADPTPGDGGGPTTPGAGVSPFATGAISQVNATASGAGADGGDLNSAALSPDGTKVAFWSDATNLVPGVGGGGLLHLYVKDLVSGGVTAVDRAQDGTLGNDGGYASEARVITWNPNGHELLFSTYATNLVNTSLYSGGGSPYLLAKDLNDQSVGFIAAGAYEGSWAPNGSHIAFTSRYVNGCAGLSSCTSTTNGSLQAFAWQVGTSTYRALSANAAGVLPTDGTGPLDADDLAWSPDSSRVAFMSYSKELVPGDTNASRDVFVKTVATGAIDRISTAPGGVQANNSSDKPAWSPDGSRIAFASSATNLVVGDNNAYQDVFVKDLASGAVTPVSVRQDGRFPLGVNGSDIPKWSPDGSKILFSSNAVDLIDGAVDKNTYNDIYVKDLASGVVRLVSVLPDGTNASSRSTLYGIYGSAWAPDGKSVYFLSASTNLAAQDNNAFGNDLFRKFLD